MEIAEEIIKKIHTILLVDWPDHDIPITLVRSGFTVFSYSPEGYKQVLMKTTPAAGPRDITHSVPVTETPKDGLIFRPLHESPVAVDLVMIYRPPEEHASIIRDHLLPLNAKVIWLQPPVESVETKKTAVAQGLIFVQGRDIRELCQ